MRTIREIARDMSNRGHMAIDAATARHTGARSYAQCGEDLLLRFAFNSIGVYRPSYLDIGAHDPIRLSNTALFYKLGARGINIEPNSELYRNFVRMRRKDVNLNIGLGDTEGTLDFYLMDNPELSTFSKTTAEAYERERGNKVREIRPIPVRRVSDVVREYFSDRPPDLLCVDTEGLDIRILRALDYGQAAPLAICVETIDYATGRKSNREAHDLLEAQGYFVYADTWINTIFFHRERFDRMRSSLIGHSSSETPLPDLAAPAAVSP